MRAFAPAWVGPAAAALLLAAAPVRAAAPPEATPTATYNTYWGDLHGHSMNSPVTLTPSVVETYIRWARDTRGLNFVALTEKDFDLSDQEWNDCKSRAAAFTSSGTFVAFSAFEWGDKEYGDFGHRPVYYPTDDQPILRSDVSTTDHVSEFLERLATTTTGVTSIAHPDLSNYTTDWDYFDGTSDYVAEIYSRHGHYETGDRGVQQALAQGYRFGFVAVSDTRAGTPGSHGLTAILASSLSKSSLHTALKARRTYATTGAKIEMRVIMDGRDMGAEYVSSTGPTMTVNCTPTASLRFIEVVKNNTVVYTYLPGGSVPVPEPSPWRIGPQVTEVLPDPAGAAPEGTLPGAAAKPAPESARARLHGFCTYDLEAIPENPILRVDLQGEYRIALNGRWIVDTHTMSMDDPDRAHDCNSPDAHALVGTLERFRELGFYDLESLGAALRLGENVLEVEYDAAEAPAAPPVQIENRVAAAPVSFLWADNGFTGPSFYYVRVTQTDGHQAWSSPIWVDRAAPDTTPPQAPTKMRVNKDGNDAYLDWPKVTKDTSNNLESVSFYRVFRGTAPDFVPDRSGLTNQIGTATKSRYRDSNALLGGTNYYYRVTAVDAAGNESPAQSNLGFKKHHPLVFRTDLSNIFWLSIPYQPIYDTADELARDLNRGSSGPCTKVVRWNVNSQRPESWVRVNGTWAGTNFQLLPGDAVAVVLAQNQDAMLVGAHDEGTPVRLTKVPGGGPSLNWVSVPIHSPHVLAHQLVQDINNGYYPSVVTAITRFNPDLQAAQTYRWTGTSWSGTNFVLIPGEAYGVEVANTADWLPDTQP